MRSFIPIDVHKHREIALDFRRDSFVVSFGDLTGFNEAKYIEWLKETSQIHSQGFVLVAENEKWIGQLELSIKEYNGTRIGYIHLYYLIPEKRGKGIGKDLYEYAVNFFREHGFTEYHLRVSVTNKNAMKFYQKLGMEELGSEIDGKVLRMKGSL